MKIDYNKLMKQEISNLSSKPRLLLHCCCAPCSSAVIERLSQFFDITYFYYNPNIFPEEEYKHRGEEFNKLGIKIVELKYNHADFLKIAKGLENEPEGGQRCKVCIAQRLNKTFEFALENDFDMVSTTLSISPHKDAEFINQLGETYEKKFGIKFLHADFKKENGYLRSIQICKEKGIYRQEYCGCEFGKSNLE